MNDSKRTASYLIVAALAVVIAWEPWARRSPQPSELEETGKLFPEFTDPLTATSMRIVKYDEDTGTLHPFKVAQVNGVWSIPSHQNYPADARAHLADAALSLINLQILGVASTGLGEHETFGVLDPDAKDLAAGAQGVGTRVTMKDGKENVLADLIIGKEVKDQPQLRYVRKPNRPQVYRVAVKSDKLSTKFGDWIEKDLLKLNPLDVRALQLNDYSIAAGLSLQGQRLQTVLTPDLRSQIMVDYDETKSAWKLAKIVEFEDNRPVESELKEDEELNAEKLNTLKTALDDLQIVDVQRKPKGMKGLEVDQEILKNPDLMRSLQSRGFYAAMSPDRTVQIYSSEGEAICRMQDGVEYLLRFGKVAGGADDEEDAENKSSAELQASKGVNRFLFVSARFNQDLIPKPKLESLPGDEPQNDAAEGGAAEAGAADTDAAADADAAAQPADKQGGTNKADPKKADPKKADPKKADAKQDQPAETKDAAPTAADQQQAEEDAAERKKQEAEKRAATEKENQRKQDDYDEKVKKGKDHVKELNNRFADWYYIISDEVYKKVHLGRGDVVKTKDKKAGEGDTPADLNQLEQSGLPK